MSDLLCTVAPVALRSSVAGAVAPPLVDGVELRLLYDPFAPQEVEIHELGWRKGRRLSAYLKDMPTEAKWMVFHNGIEIVPAEIKKIKVEKGDRIGVLLIPQGDNVKSILRVVLQVAALALQFIPGIGTIASIAIMAGLMLVSTFLLTPKMKSQSSTDDGQSYGIDGAKNSATEGIPYPVVYGEFRCAGNFSDVYTENSGDDQYLYLRSVLNDGLVESITNIELNEQPLASFTNVETQVAIGTLTQNASPWFGRSVVQRNKGIKLTTDWTNHVTQQMVDLVRFDLAFSQGLVSIDPKKGTHLNKQCGFEFRLRKLDPITRLPITAWTGLPHNTPSIENNTGATTGPDWARFAVQTTGSLQYAMANPVGPAAQTIRYRKAGTSSWTTAPPATFRSDNSFAFDESFDGTVAGVTDITPMYSNTYDIDLSANPGVYEIEGVNGASVKQVVSYPAGATGSIVFTDNRTRQIRKTIESTRVDFGYYEVGIRRQSPQSTVDNIIDEVYLTDIGEITADPVNLRGTANLALRVKLNEQLNQIPGMTAKVKGCVVQRYDIEGNPTTLAWSNNPAWIALDILLSQARGAGMQASRMDWPAWIEFALYCELEGLTFNGVFDTGTNIGDALMQVCRIGHAMPIPFGTRISVAVDRKREPVAMFTSASVIDGTFEMGYLSMADRANEFEVSYYDKNDRNKQKAIRYVDQKAVTFNELPRKADVVFQGIDNLDQAIKELWRAIYSNRLIVRTATLEVFMEAIAMSIGDVALLQHMQMEWAESGRLATGSTASIVNLDQKVVIAPGKTYAMLTHYSWLPFANQTVNNVIGRRLFVPTSTASDAVNKIKLTRLRLAAVPNVEYGIVDIEPGTVYDTIVLDRAPADIVNGSVITLIETDAIVERVVSSVANLLNGCSAVTLATPLPSAPTALSNFVFGERTMVKKPFVLTGISGQGVDRRRLNFMEYHEGVYGPPEVEIPIPVTRVTDRNVGHVTGLLFDYNNSQPADRRSMGVRVHWNASTIINYAGCDVYMSRNGAAFRAIASALSTNEINVECAPEDTVAFKAVAYNKRGDRAPLNTAPVIAGTLRVNYAALDPPTGVIVGLANFDADGLMEWTWTYPVDTTGIEGYEIEYRLQGSTNWTTAGVRRTKPTQVAGFVPGTYDWRIRSKSQTSFSTWVVGAFAVVATAGSLWQLRPAEPGADVTATSQIVVGISSDKTVPATYTGDVTAGALAALVWVPVVTKGGTSVKIAAGTTYALSNPTGVVSGTGFVVDNGAGSSTKGNVSIAAGTVLGNTSSVDLVVTVDGIAQPKITLKLVKQQAAAPPPAGTATKMATWSAGELQGINSTSYLPVVSPVKTLAIASGESLYATAPLDYGVSGSGGVSRRMTFNWQYSPAGANTWSDFAASITGSVATSADFVNELDSISGYVAVSQVKSGLAAGNWDVRLVAYCSATGRTCTPFGTATCEAKV